MRSHLFCFNVSIEMVLSARLCLWCFSITITSINERRLQGIEYQTCNTTKPGEKNQGNNEYTEGLMKGSTLSTPCFTSGEYDEIPPE